MALYDMFFSANQLNEDKPANKIFLQLHKSTGSTFCIESIVLKRIKEKFSLTECSPLCLT